ncbi:hypothetical protein EUGRSUZ_C03970 [Eucalyptus grandis]|uniref:TIR domain-containing protein n=2 Tax=Eucalyptus grandis TaxID=71139 RepID=A0A059CX88_EUCGR|nr:hypothetical protein EUGRSUZ_C03970 [Eucalyptus grandis]
MIRVGICVFKDDEMLHVGEEIRGELLRAISNSKIYIPIFSKNYASSKCCLCELAYMVECRKRDKKVILPIFYGVDAFDLKLRTGSYGKALRKHERQSGEDTMKQWEEALREIAKIKGYNLKDHGCCFLSDIRKSDILSLQKKLSRDILGIQHPKVIDVDEGRDVIKQKLGDKKAIILAGKSSWFGSGSRIIITTRNTNFLALETDTLDDNIIHGDFSFYEMKELQFHHALQLFSKHSFESDSPPYDYIEISREIVGTTGGLPLALEVIGSLLHSKGKKTWKETLKKLKEVPNQDVQKKLLISYEELEYEQQQIFLDIACHCIGEERIPTYYMWKACDFFPHTGLHDRLWMHDQLRDLGREIVRRECFTVPGKCSRLWCPTIALDVVKNNMFNHVANLLLWKYQGTKIVVALKLTRLGDKHNFTSGEFSRLPSLRFLELNGGNFVGDFKNLLSTLTWLSWHHCPSNLDATGLCLRNLAVLKLLESDIIEDWNGWGACMRNISPTVPPLLDSIGGLKSLLVLNIKNQDGVRKLPPSIGELLGLKHLSLSKCCNLRELPDSIGELKSLLHLDLQYTSVSALPDSIGELKSLLHLDLQYTESVHKLDVSSTPITKLLHSIGNLRWLKLMILSSSKISELPKSIGTLENLEELRANNCVNLKGEIPSELAGLSQLEILSLSGTKVNRLPMTINQLFNLRQLELQNCMEFQLLPNLPTSVTRLDLTSSSLQAIPDLSNLTNLGQIVYPNLEWLGRLHELSSLHVIFSDSDMHPTDLSALSQLKVLDITCADLQSLTGLPSSLEIFDLRGLENFKLVDVLKGESLVRISNVSSLKEHQSLWVKDCPQLIEIASERPSIGDCSSTERPNPNSPKLEKLPVLKVLSCESLQKIPTIQSTSVRNCLLLGGTWFSKL